MSGTSLTNGSAKIINNLENSLTEGITRVIGNVVESVKEKIKNAVSATVNFFTPRIELVVISMNRSSGRDFAIVTLANSERKEQAVVTNLFQNDSERNDRFHEFSSTDETRGYNPQEAHESPIPRTRPDR